MTQLLMDINTNYSEKKKKKCFQEREKSNYRIVKCIITALKSACSGIIEIFNICVNLRPVGSQMVQ